jgi:hypothetical protein
MATEAKVERMLKAVMKKNHKELDEALIKPISPEWQFSTNGIYFFVGKMGSGKSYYIWKHIYTTENLFSRPYYQEIIYCSTSGKMDETTNSMMQGIKTKISCVKESELLRFLGKHLKRKSKYYSMCKHVLSKLKKTDDKMERIIEKHSLEDVEDRLNYIAEKFCKYGTADYPYRTLLVLDDFAGSPLLKAVDGPIARWLTKTRHYHLTAIIVAQTWRFILLNLKRMATDCVIYAHFSDEDFAKIMSQTPNNCNVKETIQEYRALENSHDHFIMNITANHYQFVRVPDDKKGGVKLSSEAPKAQTA